MKGSWTYRPARMHDAPVLKAIRVAAGWGEGDVEPWLQESAAGRRVFWVAEAESRVIGMVGLKLSDPDPDVANGTDRVEIAFLAVAPEARGQGLARRLTELMERKGQELGYSVISLNTNVVNATAIHLYESMGYVEFKRG